MKDGFPCKDCMILGICRHVGTQIGGVTALARKCSLMEVWLSMNNKEEWRIENIYDAFDFFKRRWML